MINDVVFSGHPDKICNQINGALLDTFVEQAYEKTKGST